MPRKAVIVNKNPMVVEILMPSKEEYAEADRKRKIKSVVIPPIKVGDFITNSLKEKK